MHPLTAKVIGQATGTSHMRRVLLYGGPANMQVVIVPNNVNFHEVEHTDNGRTHTLLYVDDEGMFNGMPAFEYEEWA